MLFPIPSVFHITFFLGFWLIRIFAQDRVRLALVMSVGVRVSRQDLRFSYPWKWQTHQEGLEKMYPKILPKHEFSLSCSRFASRFALAFVRRCVKL